MRTRHGKQQESNDQTFFQKMVCQLSSIRARLTLWYVMTTTVVLLLFGGLLYSTIAKMLPLPDHTVLPQIALQLFLMGLAILLFITVGGYWLAIRAMRPVRLVTRTAQEIGRTDLSRRFHLKRRDELGELANTFDEMLNRLEAVLSRQRQFTADASHELRTPLSILNVAASRALSQWSRPENYEQALERIEMTNLIDNALKYTAGIGNHILIEGSIARRGEKWWGRIGIEDNGPGITEEHQLHLFERFYRVDAARSPLQTGEEDTHEETASGSGLGLAIVQWVAQVHKGEVRLLSAVGHGSCFEIWLPLLEGSDTSDEQETFL
jgi:signal transduction histidine kinase